MVCHLTLQQGVLAQRRALSSQRYQVRGCRAFQLARRVAVKAETKEQKQQPQSEGSGSQEQWVIDDDNCAYNVGEYCTIDMEGKRVVQRSLGEMEFQFLQALREFYFDGNSNISNEEFDQLKEELLWQGSKVARLSSDEQRFMEATFAYNNGEQIMSDEDYDDLKNRLKQQTSWVAAQGPRCSLRSQRMYSDATADYLKMTTLNIPAALVVLIGLYALDASSKFQITKIIEYPEPWGIIFLWGLVLPIVFFAATQLTQIAFRDNVILKGDCPNCGQKTESYFGDILVIKGSRDKNYVDCPQCTGVLEFNNQNRMITYDLEATEKKKENDRKRKEAAEKRKNAVNKPKPAENQGEQKQSQAGQKQKQEA